MLIYCTDGEGWCRIGEKIYTIKKDTYFVLPAGTPHAYGNKKGGQWAIYWIHFNGQLAADYADYIHHFQLHIRERM